MGEANRKRMMVKRLVKHARSGLLRGMPGSRLEGADPLTIARAVGDEPEAGAILEQLDGGQTFFASGERAELSKLARWGNTKDLGPLIAQAMQLSISTWGEKSLIVPIPFGGDDILDNDRQWFATNPKRWLRIREPIGDEYKVGAVKPGWVLRTLVVVLNHQMGMRIRTAFPCRPGDRAARLDLDDPAIASVVLEISNFHAIGERLGA